MKVGAEPKRLALLGALLILAGYLVYNNVLSGPTQPVRTAPAKAAAARAVPVPEIGGPVPRNEARSISPALAQTTAQEFKPTLRQARSGSALDFGAIDFTLRADLLERLHGVPLRGGARSLFDFASPPATAAPKVAAKPVVEARPAPAPPRREPAKPSPPPVPLKFYGYVSAPGQSVRRAFFLDGDQILVGSEGDILKKRYRVVRIGVNSVVVEDLEFKAEQTLPLEPQSG